MNLPSTTLWIALCILGALAGTTNTAFAMQAGDHLDDLGKKLKDADEKVRRQAVEELARLQKPEAWTLVVDALSDTSPLVADEAELRLGDLADAGVLKIVFGKTGVGAKDPLVQQRAIEAIGRIKIEVDGTALAKFLVNKDPELRCEAAHALELLVEAGKLEAKSHTFALQQLDAAFKSDKLPRVRAAIVPARNALKEYTVSELCNMLLRKNADVARASATHVLAETEFDQVIGQFNESLEDEEYSGARALVDVLRAHPRSSSAGSLAIVMRRYHSTRLDWTIVDTLRSWSGLTNGIDTQFWDEWADKLPDGWEPKERKTDPSPTGYKTAASLMGLPILSDRFFILLDASSWLGEKLGDGTIAKTKVKAELGKMLGSLPEATVFELVLYAGEPDAGEQVLVQPKSDALKHALKPIDDCPLKGRGSFLEASSLALSEKMADTMLVITDSAPSGIHHVHEDLVRGWMEQHNRFRQVVIDVLLVHPAAGVEDQWKALCAPSGGRVMRADL